MNDSRTRIRGGHLPGRHRHQLERRADPACAICFERPRTGQHRPDGHYRAASNHARLNFGKVCGREIGIKNFLEKSAISIPTCQPTDPQRPRHVGLPLPRPAAVPRINRVGTLRARGSFHTQQRYRVKQGRKRHDIPCLGGTPLWRCMGCSAYHHLLRDSSDHCRNLRVRATAAVANAETSGLPTNAAGACFATRATARCPTVAGPSISRVPDRAGTPRPLATTFALG